MLITSDVVAEEFKDRFDPIELSVVCSQVCEHYCKILSSYYNSTSIQAKTIHKLDYLMRFRLQILGRIAVDSKIENPELAVMRVILVTNSIDGNDEVTTKVHHQEMDEITFGEIHPSVMLNFLLIFLEEGVKGIEFNLDACPHYIRYSRESAVAVRDFISELRPFTKLPNSSTSGTDVSLASIVVHVDIKRPSLTN